MNYTISEYFNGETKRVWVFASEDRWNHCPWVLTEEGFGRSSAREKMFKTRREAIQKLKSLTKGLQKVEIPASYDPAEEENYTCFVGPPFNGYPYKGV